jgi:SAM-dependent methyltransferase
MVSYRSVARKSLWLVRRSWPDEGRRIVQEPILDHILTKATAQGGGFGRILNAGAGEGGYSRLLLRLPGVRSIIETDLHLNRATFGNRDSRQHLLDASLTALPLASNSINLVLCTEVLEHIPYDEAALDEIHRVLTPGGCLVVTVPTPPALPDCAHVREGYRAEELGTMLTARGFDVLGVKFCMFFFFRALIRMCRRLSWNPRIMVRGLSYLDRLVPLGSPMDLLILARKEPTGTS